MKTFLFPALVTAAALLCAPVAGHEYYAKSFKVIHPWSEPTPAGASSASVYMKIEEISEGDRLLSAETSLAEKVELRVGRVPSAPLAAIELPPGQDIDLDVTRGYLQLVNLTAPLLWGRSYPMTLVFAKSGPVDVMISVGAH